MAVDKNPNERLEIRLPMQIITYEIMCIHPMDVMSSLSARSLFCF